jgi:four helix bundle protein
MAKTCQDLMVWQIADELRREVYRLTDYGPVSNDHRLRSQLRQAAGGIATNIAEGFRRFSSRELLQFVRYAYASAGETAEWLADGVVRGHWRADEVEPARRILARLDPALLRLIRYLRSPAAFERSGGRNRKA